MYFAQYKYQIIIIIIIIITIIIIIIIESRYPGAFPPVLNMFRRAFFPGPTDRPRVSEDGLSYRLP